MLNNQNSVFAARMHGFTLLELTVFMVVLGISLGSLILVFNQSVTGSVDPIIRVQMSELAQSQLDQVIARKYDESTPTGGVPACGSAESGAPTCTGLGLDAGENLSSAATLDDVDDFNGYTDSPYSGYSRSVSVALAGSDLGLVNDQAKRITVTVSAPGNQQLTLSAYRTNF